MTRPTTWLTSPTSFIDVAGERLAYRDLGDDAPGTTPLLVLVHLAATLDEWDPAVIDPLAAGRRVIAVDLPGVGRSTGVVPRTIAGMADAARAFVHALGLTQVDVLGFSMGGMVAQQLVLDEPTLVRRLILTGTGPVGGDGIAHTGGGAYIYWDMARAAVLRTDVKELLFFTRDRAAIARARAYLERIGRRRRGAAPDHDEPIALRSFQRQAAAVQDWGRRAPQDLGAITAPPLIVNGDHDRMVPSRLSLDMHERIRGSELVIYRGAGHGSLVEYPEDFTRRAVAHLDS